MPTDDSAGKAADQTVEPVMFVHQGSVQPKRLEPTPAAPADAGIAIGPSATAVAMTVVRFLGGSPAAASRAERVPTEYRSHAAEDFRSCGWEVEPNVRNKPQGQRLMGHYRRRLALPESLPDPRPVALLSPRPARGQGAPGAAIRLRALLRWPALDCRRIRAHREAHKTSRVPC